MRAAIVLAVLVASIAANAGEKIPIVEARTLAKNLETIDGSIADDVWSRLLYKQCAELPTCAGPCQRVLDAAGQGSVDDSMLSHLFAQCSPDFKRQPANVTVWNWFHDYFVRFAARAVTALPAAERPAFQRALARRKLTAK